MSIELCDGNVIGAGEIVFSKDGKNWERSILKDKSNLRSITYGKNTYVICGDKGSIFGYGFFLHHLDHLIKPRFAHHRQHIA